MAENKPNIQYYDKLVSNISKILLEAKSNIATIVNTTMVLTNWHIGQYIVEYEQGGKERAKYGTQLLKLLSEDLTKEFGRGFSYRNLRLFKQFHLGFPIWQTASAKSINSENKKLQTESAQLSFEKGQTVSAKFSDKAKASLSELTWSHSVRLLSVKDENERNFYIIETAENNWKERELDQQINLSFYLPN